MPKNLQKNVKKNSMQFLLNMLGGGSIFSVSWEGANQNTSIDALHFTQKKNVLVEGWFLYY
jgi:hypothetical protein